MSIGNSGRIVIEVDPDLKKGLYSALAKDGMSLKEWFLKGATAYLEHASQLPLNLPEQGSDNQFTAQRIEKKNNK